MDKTPKPGTRRRSLYDLLVSRPDEWIDFDPRTLGYASPRSGLLKADIRALRDIYNLQIQTAGMGPRHMSLALRAGIARGVPLAIDPPQGCAQT